MARIGVDDTQRPSRNAADRTGLVPARSEQERGSSTTPPHGGRSSGSGADRLSSQRRTRVAEGVYKDDYGLAATVKVQGVQREKRFPADTPLKTIRAWRDQTRASLRTQPVGERHTLAADADSYLDLVNGELVSISDRRYHISLWVDCFGHLRTLELPLHMPALNDQLRRWRKSRSASACNHRRDALTNLVRVIYGRRAAMEFIDLVRFPAPPPRPRWIERTHIADVLEHLTPGSKTVVRLRLMHWTGMRPSQMARLEPDNFRLAEPVPYVVVPRGKQGRLASLPLVGKGLDAAREFMAIRAYGRWSCSAANKALARAAGKAGRPAFTVYQIRHAFATGLRRTGSDVADIQDLYGHTDPETTMIYAPPHIDKHVEAIARLQRADGAAAPVLHAIRLADTVGSDRRASGGG